MRHIVNIVIATTAVAVVVAVLVVGGILADALHPVIATVAGGVVLIGIVMLVAWREGGRP